MSETTWLTTAYPAPLVKLYRRVGLASRRKAVLFACGCCRRVWDRLDGPGRAAVQAAERFADGECSGLAVEEVARRATGAASFVAPDPHIWTGRAASAAAVLAAMAWRVAYERETGAPVPPELLLKAVARERAAQAGLFRDLVGNPYRPPAFSPMWRTGPVVELARAVHRDRAFELLPILADALEEAGCTDPAVLAHCRQGEPAHVLGCWVIDLVLGRC